MIPTISQISCLFFQPCCKDIIFDKMQKTDYCRHFYKSQISESNITISLNLSHFQVGFEKVAKTELGKISNIFKDLIFWALGWQKRTLVSRGP